MSTKEKSGNVTTTTTKTSYKVDADNVVIRPTIAPRPVLSITRSYGGPLRASGGGGGSSFGMRSSMSTSSSSAPSGAFLKMTGMGSQQVKGQRVKEKKDLQDLNERLADYIEKVRFLEAQNRKLAMELEALKANWGKETTAIKSRYEVELATARHLLDESEKDRAALEIRIQTITDELAEKMSSLEDLQKSHVTDTETINRQNQQLADYESELGLLRRRVASLEKDYNKDKADIKRLNGELQRSRQDLDNETLNRVIAQNEKQSAVEELDFLKQIHEQEMKELAALAYRDTTAENREYWKSELSQALHDIQQEYDCKLDQIRVDIDSYYSAKLDEFGAGQTRSSMETAHAKEEVKKLRGQVGDLRAKLADLESKNAHLEKMYNDTLREYEEKKREWELEKSELEQELINLKAELESVLVELQNMFDAKMSLELEIAAYRKLLEGEETRSGMTSLIQASSASNQQSAAPGGGLGASSGGGYSASSGGGGGGGGGGGYSASSGGGYSVSSGGGSGGGFSSSSSSSGGGGGGGGGMSMSSASSAGMAGGAGTTTKTSSSSSADSANPPSQAGKRGGMKGEMSAKTTYQRSAKGNVSIAEISSDGRFLILENTGGKEENVSGWKINRRIDNRTTVTYTLPSNCKLQYGQNKNKLKIWAKGAVVKANERSDSDIDANVAWGMGANIHTTMTNADNEEKATHIQKTQYS